MGNIELTRDQILGIISELENDPDVLSIRIIIEFLKAKLKGEC